MSYKEIREKIGKEELEILESLVKSIKGVAKTKKELKAYASGMSLVINRYESLVKRVKLRKKDKLAVLEEVLKLKITTLEILNETKKKNAEGNK